MKKFLVALLSAIILVTGVAFITACDSCGSDSEAKEVLKTYILPQTEQPVEDDFTLDRKVNGEPVEWTSNNTNAIAIENYNDDYYLAKVTMGDAQQEVKLTASHGEEKKDFTVTVQNIDVLYLAGKYVFKQKGLSVFDDFDLDKSFTYKGATVLISWEVESGSDYISVNAAGDKCIVNGSSINPQVKLKATFTYKNEDPLPISYSFIASESITHEEMVDNWFNGDGTKISEISGYVVEIAIARTDDGKIGVYVIDDDFCSGYYLYYIPIDDANYAELKVGSHVTATGFTCSPYNGLPETKSGSGKLVVDTDKTALTAEQLAEKIYAIDNDILVGAPAAKYHTSTQVSLDKWTVDEVKTSIDNSSGTQTLFVLKKGEAKVSVVVTRYLAGAYTYKYTKNDPVIEGDETYNALAALLKTVNKGDVVSIKKGILSYSNGYQVIPYSASDVKVETVAATAVPEACTKVAAAIKEVGEVLTGDLISKGTTLTVPQPEGVTVKVELLKESENITLANNVITVKVVGEENVVAKVTYTFGDYSTYVLYNVHTKEVAAADVVAEAKENLTLPNILLSNTLLKDKDADNSAEISWKLKTDVAGVSIADGKLVNATNEDKQVTLVATIEYDSATDTKEIPVTLKGVLGVSDVTAANVNLALYQANKQQVLYLTGEMNGYYFATTNDASKAAEIQVAAVEGGYTFKVVSSNKYIEIVVDGTHTNVVFSETASNGVWVYNAELKVFTWTLGEKIYYLGTFGNNVTMSASETYRISGDNASAVGVSQFPACFVKPTEGGTTPTQPISGKETYTFNTTNIPETAGKALDNAGALTLLNNACTSTSTLTAVEVTNVYPGTGSGGAHPDTAGILKMGKSKNAGKLVLTFSSNVAKVEIKCHDFYKQSTDYPTTSRTVSVNGAAQTSPYNANGDAEVLEFTLATASNVVTIDTSERAYIYEIVIIFAE